MLTIIPIDFKDACLFIKEHHRHHKPPQGHKFSIAIWNGNDIVGVAIVGRPVARHLDNGWTLEVIRCCTDGTKNGCSKLYAACWNVVKAMGYRQLITYILDTESGISLRAAGWKCLGRAGGGSWNWSGRPRLDTNPTQQKIKFSISII
jgi:hypothetical protein